MYRYLNRLVLAGTAVLAFANTGWAQLDAVNKRIEAIEQQMIDGRFSPTPQVIKGIQNRELTLIEPLRWELRKLEIQRRVLRDMKMDYVEQLDRTGQELSVVDKELQTKGILEEGDLRKLMEQRVELKQSVKQAEAELTETIEAFELARAQAAKAKGGQQQAIALQQQLVTLAQEEVEHVRQLVKNAVVSKEAVRESQRKLLVAEQELAVLTAGSESELEELERDYKPHIESLHRLLEENKAALEAVGNADLHKVRFLLSQRQQLQREQQTLSDFRASLDLQSANVELQFAYLKAVLSEYEEALEEAPEGENDTVKPAEEQEQPANDDSADDVAK